jgi:hypothetical protein
MSLVLNGSGSITGLSAGGLPDGSVTADDIASTLDLSGKTVTLPSGTGGKVLQVVGMTPTQQFSTSSTNWTEVTSNSITPSSASNNILVQVTGSYGINRTGDQLLFVSKLDRDIGGSVTEIRTAYGAHSNAEYVDAHYRYVNSSNAWMGSHYSLNRLDSPATTSAITYKLYTKNYGSMTAVYMGGLVITLLEIAA